MNGVSARREQPRGLGVHGALRRLRSRSPRLALPQEDRHLSGPRPLCSDLRGLGDRPSSLPLGVALGLLLLGDGLLLRRDGHGRGGGADFLLLRGGRLKHLAVGVEGHHLSGLFLLREELVGARGTRRNF